MILYIVGFMGAGKSSLSDFWRHDFPGVIEDLDHIIARKVGVNPDELGNWIREEGFSRFRFEESKALGELIQKYTNKLLLLSLGGGAYHPVNREILKGQQGIWVDSPVETCWQRVSGDLNRPLVGQGKQAFLDLYLQRLPDYEQANYRLSGLNDWPSFQEFCKKYKIQGLMD